MNAAQSNTPWPGWIKAAPQQPAKRTDYRAIIASVMICLVIGFAYCWSIFEKAFVLQLGWTNAQASLPYSVFMVFFAGGMLLGGIAQDRFGPQKVCSVGVALLLSGLTLSALSKTIWGVTLGFGLLAGSGQSICYNCVVSTPLKWVSEKKRGLVTGITIGAVGLTGIYMNPLTNFFIRREGVSAGFLVMLLLISLVAVPMSLWVKNPPQSTTEKKAVHGLAWRRIISQPSFWMIFLMSFSCSLYGQIIVGHITNIAYVQADWQNGYYLTILLSLFNCLGRFFGGMLSDFVSGPKLLRAFYAIGAANILLFRFYHNAPLLIIGTALVGVGYGASHSILPTIVADVFGTECFGRLFGLTSISAGLAGAVGPILAGYVMDVNGSYQFAYLIGAVCLSVASFAADMVGRQHKNIES